MDTTEKKAHQKSSSAKQHGRATFSTSETFRIAPSNPNNFLVDKHQPPANSTNSSLSRKKASSFQITSVSVNAPTRTSADNGDDSADDLDESHTDDNSRITDLENETPSFSEDTSFSKEDGVFFTNMSSAPVIPTSSQYGLAIVPDLGGGSSGQSIQDVHVSVQDAGINLMGHSKQEVDFKDMHHKNERFKVVKIESTEPFKRGRWMCMDYLDHTTLQAQSPPNSKESEDLDPSVTTNNANSNTNQVTTKDSGIGMGEMLEEHSKEDVAAPPISNSVHSVSDKPISNSQASHAQTLTFIPITNNLQPSAHQSMPPGQLQQMLSQMHHPTPIPIVDQNQQNIQNQNIQSQQNIQNLQNQQPQAQHHHHHYYAQSMTPEMIQHSLQQVQHFHAGSTLPANILMQHLGLHAQQQQSQQSHQIPPVSTNVTTSNVTSVTNANVPNIPQQVNQANAQPPQPIQIQEASGGVESESMPDLESASVNNNSAANATISSPLGSAGTVIPQDGGASALNVAGSTNNAVSDGSTNENSANSATSVPEEGQSEDSERWVIDFWIFLRFLHNNFLFSLRQRFVVAGWLYIHN